MTFQVRYQNRYVPNKEFNHMPLCFISRLLPNYIDVTKECLEGQILLCLKEWMLPVKFIGILIYTDILPPLLGKTNFLGKKVYISTTKCPLSSTWNTKLLKTPAVVYILLPSFSLGFKAVSSFFCFASSSSRFSCRASFRSSSLQREKYLQEFNLPGNV